jgi:hypothetical protein
MASARTRIAVVGRDPVVGAALEALLESAGYHAWFLPESVKDELGELLADSQLLVVTPDLSAEVRHALLKLVLSPKGPVKIAVLELLPANGEEQIFGGHAVFWPCSVEELRQAIDAALLAQWQVRPK